MKAFVCAPVRNRAWVLPEYCEAIIKQGVEYETCFLVNDCEDNSEDVLKSYGFRTEHHHFHSHKTEQEVRGRYSFWHLAQLRNQLVEYFLQSDCDVFVSIDSDIVIPEHSLQQLLSHDKDIISMLIRNHPTISAYNVMVDGKHFSEPPPLGLIEIDLTGAVYAVKREVLEAGVRYAGSNRGEDLPFCEEARKRGYRLYCDTTLNPIHRYDKNTSLIAKAGE